MALKVLVARNYASKSREAFKWVNKNRDTKNGREDPNNITRNNRDARRDASNIRGACKGRVVPVTKQRCQ
jgi:hypothetical protein